MIASVIIWICTATNIQGDTFQAYDANEDQAAQRAFALCQTKNERCYPRECREMLHIRDRTQCHLEIPTGHMESGIQCNQGEVMTGFWVTQAQPGYLMCAKPEIQCD